MDILDLRQLGQHARWVREQAGLTQAEVARRIGSSQPNVSAAERGLDTRHARVAVRVIEDIGNQTVHRPLYGISDERPDANGR